MAQLQPRRPGVHLRDRVELAFDDRQNTEDAFARYTDEILELRRYARDDFVGFLDRGAKKLLGAVTLRLAPSTIPSRQCCKHKRDNKADAGAPCDAAVGGGQRLGVPQLPLLFLALTLKPREPFALVLLFALAASA